MLFALLLVVSEVLPFIAQAPGDGIVHCMAKFGIEACKRQLERERIQSNATVFNDPETGRGDMLDVRNMDTPRHHEHAPTNDKWQLLP